MNRFQLSPLTHGKSYTKVYAAWRSMKQRCYCKNNQDYRNYGGRGIIVCAEWLDSFEQFYADMGDPPSTKHSLDRIDVDGRYCKENCRWITQKEQMQNCRSTILIQWEGGLFSITELCQLFDIPRKRLEKRLKLGWDIESALLQPPLKKGGMRNDL